jgi:alpha-tubulin suppressor-like RCC1 family protein
LLGRQLKCAGDNCCALRNGGSLYCWGDNRDGNAGVDRGDGTPIDVPTQVGGDKTFLPAFSVGKTHSCAIASDRALWCWGNNKWNQLGVAGMPRALAPVKVGENNDWLWVAAGGTQTCGIRKGNVLYCWGDNTDGQVGIERVGPDGEVVVTDKPVIVTMTNDWVRVATGDRHACAIKSGQPLFCWGNGDSGELGMREVEMLEAPAKLAAEQRYRELALGAAFSCGLDVTEPQPRMYCWGANDRGQLGTGDTDPRREPTLVEL